MFALSPERTFFLLFSGFALIRIDIIIDKISIVASFALLFPVP